MKPGGRSSRRGATALLLGLICVVYSLVGLEVAQRLGLLRDLETVLFATPDARTLSQLSDQLSGPGDALPPVYLSQLADYVSGRRDSRPQAYRWRRPFLYPLFLTSHRVVGVAGFALLQWCCTLATLVLTFLSIRVLTGSALVSTLGVALLAVQPSFGLIALHALTESLAFAMVAAFVWLLTLFYTRGRRPRHLLWSIFFLSGASCVKVAYLPLLVLWGAAAVFRLFRRAGSPLGVAGRLVLAGSPVLLQLALSLLVLGEASMAGTGRMNFQHKYFPAICGLAEHGELVRSSDPRAAECKKANLGVSKKVVYLLKHPRATLDGTASLVRGNISAPSFYVSIPSKLIADWEMSDCLARFSERFNAAMLPVHVLAVLSIAALLALRRMRRERSGAYLWLAAMTAVLLLSSALSYDQGDRLTLAAAPLWCVLYPALAALAVGCGLRGRQQTQSRADRAISRPVGRGSR